MYVTIKQRGKSCIVSVCDDELIGKTLKEKDLVFEIIKPFFGGRKEPLKELKELLEEYDNITLVGNKVVEEAIRLGFVTKDNVKTINKVKWAICLG